MVLNSLDIDRKIRINFKSYFVVKYIVIILML
jgi:hypothetical protein